MSQKSPIHQGILHDGGQYYRQNRRLKREALLPSLGLLALGFSAAVLLAVLVIVFRDGWSWLSWNFLTSFPSRFPERAGILSALLGTLWIIGLTALLAVPIGIATAVYLVEYPDHPRWKRLLEVNVANLAGVPSIIYGLLGLAIFVRWMALDRSILAGALTTTLLVLPIIIIASVEALKAVPSSLRDAAKGLGVTRRQIIWGHIMPSALPGILTGIILAISRGLGESAPLIMIGALSFVAFVPTSPGDSFTVLAIQIFNWAGRPQPDFQGIAAAGIIVLLTLTLGLNAIAIYLRAVFLKKAQRH